MYTEARTTRQFLLCLQHVLAQPGHILAFQIEQQLEVLKVYIYDYREMGCEIRLIWLRIGTVGGFFFNMVMNL
jgi:hypothetical protein